MVELHKGIIDEFALRQTMLTISGEIDTVVEVGRTTEELQKRKDGVLLKYKKLGRKSILQISPEFSDMLKKELATFNAFEENIHGGFVRHVLKDLFQADSLIVYRAIQKKSLRIVSADSDLPLLIGIKSIMIRGFKLSRSRIKKLKDDQRLTEVSCIEVSGCCNKTMSWVKDIIGTSCDMKKSKRIWKEAKYPVCSDKNERIRVIVAIVLGSDIFVGGANNIGSAKVWNFYKKL